MAPLEPTCARLQLDSARQVIETPPALRERVKLAIQPRNAVNLPGSKSGNE
jgi:hypothetical protein